MTTTQLREGQARASDWVSHHNNLELAAQKVEAKELDSFATAAQP